MPKPRLEKTPADYVAIAIGPVLIMLLVGSLVFFLAEVATRGAAVGTFHWILAWYTLATVLISRIGIEQGRGYAAGYGLALGAVTSLVIVRLVNAYVPLALLLLGVVWWATGKLVWDCTLIDDQQDASGQGLLQASGLETAADGGPDDQANAPRSQPGGDSSNEADATNPAGTAKSADRSFWTRIADRLSNAPLEGGSRNRKPHAPGVWVVYFSLAALPLFGLGQLVIPADAGESRSFAFRMLLLYVASALALLVTTSFLGMRRYLRQRKLKMPTSVTRSWLATGGALILAIMVVCLLIPRPQAAYSLTHAVDGLATKIDKASRNAFVKGEAGEGDGKRIGDRDEEIDRGEGGGNAGKEDERGGGGGKKQPGGDGDGKAKKGGGKQKGKGNAGKQNNQKGNQKQKQNKNNAQGGGEKQNGKQNDGENPNDQNRGRNAERGGQRNDSANNSSSSTARPPGWIGSTVKWIIYGLLAVAVVVLCVKYREQIAAGLRRFLADLRNLFARKPKPDASGGESSGEAGAVKPRPRPFSSFANPFSTGSASQMPIEALIAYTFEAMEAWAYDQGVDRRYEQTPVEFANELGEQTPGFAKDAAQVARLYTRANYSDRKPTDRCRAVLEQAWRTMQR